MRWSRSRERRNEDPGPDGAAPGDEISRSPLHIDGYENLAVIGHGASATVYRARQHEFDRMVAVKILNVDVSDRRAQRRFTRERELNGRLSNHPNVVTVLDAGFVDGRYPYLAMEYFERGSLAERVAARGPVSVEVALHIGVKIAGALQTAHDMGILHRDVKPQNLLLSRYGEPALADFGIATILEMEHSLTAALTPVHAAPEILEGADPSAGADVYALASTVYTLLAGTPPFAGPPGEGMLAQLLRITTSELPALPRSDVPPSLVDALRAATAKRPDERTATAAAFGQVLQRVQAELRLQPTPLPVEDPEDLAEGGEQPATADLRSPDAIAATSEPTPPPVASSGSMSPGASTSFRTDSDPGDRTVGHPLDSPTVAARQQHAAAEPSSDTRRRWPIVTAAVVSAALIGGAAVVVMRPTGDETAPHSTTIPTAPMTATTAPSTFEDGQSAGDVSQYAPTGLSVSIEDGAVFLAWTDNTGGQRPHLVETHPRTAAIPPQPADREVTAVEVAGADPTAPLCFVVRAVVELGDPPVTADSEPACINDAVATGATIDTS